jgi:hypothetical protein
MFFNFSKNKCLLALQVSHTSTFDFFPFGLVVLGYRSTTLWSELPIGGKVFQVDYSIYEDWLRPGQVCFDLLSVL